MKKAISGIIIAALVLAMLAGCASKEAMTISTFKEYAESNGFTVEDAQQEFGKEGVTEGYWVADGENYDLEFISFYEEDDARSGYYGICSSLDDELPAKSNSVEASSSHYDAYYFNADGAFYMVFRVKNTVLCSASEVEYREQMLNCAKAMGYK